MSLVEISAEAVGRLNLRGLMQISSEDAAKSNFVFLDMGEIILDYNCSIERSKDAFADRLAGAETPYFLGRNTLRSAGLTRGIPKDSTHYCLGNKRTLEELYLEHASNSFSKDIIFIVFLKK